MYHPYWIHFGVSQTAGATPIKFYHFTSVFIGTKLCQTCSQYLMVRISGEPFAGTTSRVLQKNALLQGKDIVSTHSHKDLGTN